LGKVDIQFQSLTEIDDSEGLEPEEYTTGNQVFEAAAESHPVEKFLASQSLRKTVVENASWDTPLTSKSEEAPDLAKAASASGMIRFFETADGAVGYDHKGRAVIHRMKV